MKILFLVISLFLATPVSAGGSWVLTGKLESRSMSFYSNPSTLKKSGAIRKIWTLIDFGPRNNSFKSVVGLEEYDCANEKTRVLSATVYSGQMGSGDVVTSTDEPAAWNAVIPNSTGSFQYDAVCKM